MGGTALVWLRRDLRVHDQPALAAAARAHDHVVPVFVLDPVLLEGRNASAARNAFLLASLAALDSELRPRGGALVVRAGEPAVELARLAAETGARALHRSSDFSPFARAREREVDEALRLCGTEVVRHDDVLPAGPADLRNREDRPFSTFTHFHRAWLAGARGAPQPAPPRLTLPPGLETGTLPPSRPPLAAGERAARTRMEDWLAAGVERYHLTRDLLAAPTSGLSPYLHLGCLSPRELEQRVAALVGEGPAAFRRQLAWRDFYAQVLRHNPQNARHEHQPRFRALEWDADPELFDVWREGRTGYPLVDAAMRQLAATGWMHNRARLVAGSFLTKQLHLDWRLGERHFMNSLLDGDMASNNGNWQWVASVGVDPAPYFRRIYNPALQQRRHDPAGEYVRRWLPELRAVTDEQIAEPWRMSAAEQRAAGCVIGRDYPAPVVDHARERRRVIERYRAALAA